MPARRGLVLQRHYDETHHKRYYKHVIKRHSPLYASTRARRGVQLHVVTRRGSGVIQMLHNMKERRHDT